MNNTNREPIIIWGQSLNNDGKDNICIDGQYLDTLNSISSQKINELMSNMGNIKMQNSSNKEVKYGVINDVIIFEVYAIEKDISGRISPLTIQLPLQCSNIDFDKSMIVFEQATNRHITDINRIEIFKIIKRVINNKHKRQTLNIFVIMVIFSILGAVIAKFLGFMIGIIIGCIIGIIINKYKLSTNKN